MATGWLQWWCTSGTEPGMACSTMGSSSSGDSLESRLELSLAGTVELHMPSTSVRTRS